jgi:PAS domain S-box-containing protein
MSVEPTPAPSDFAEFAEALRSQRTRSEQVVRHALSRVEDRYPDATSHELSDVSRVLEGTLGDLDRAAEELCAQNEALFEARLELEGTSAMFRDLFELAPSAYVVTAPDTRIMYANDATCELLCRRKNALAGKPLIAYVPLEERNAFRSAVARANESDSVSAWTATLIPTGTSRKITCRMRIRPVSAPSVHTPRALYWNITEETDEDLF